MRSVTTLRNTAVKTYSARKLINKLWADLNLNSRKIKRNGSLAIPISELVIPALD